jgi:type III pantothenate kinase
MKLLFDIGNTRIKWACDTGSELLYPGELVHRGLTPEQAITFITEFEPELNVESAWAINVAGAELEHALAQALELRFGLELQVARTAKRCGEVINGYTAIEQLGADRWAAIVGAWKHFQRSVCVVDVGTAVTVDVVAANGGHQGGIILPGLVLMTESLNRDTSDIEGFSSESHEYIPGDDWLGRDTLSAVQSGAVFALRSVICQAVKQISEQDGAAPLVVLTGGDAKALLPLPDFAVELMPMLVLEGLSYLTAETE